METNLRATFAGITIVLSFCDEEQSQFYDPKLDNLVGLKIDYIGATCNEIVLTVQVSSAFSLPLGSCLRCETNLPMSALCYLILNKLLHSNYKRIVTSIRYVLKV